MLWLTRARVFVGTGDIDDVHGYINIAVTQVETRPAIRWCGSTEPEVGRPVC
jgi:hypothetical protein